MTVRTYGRRATHGRGYRAEPIRPRGDGHHLLTRNPAVLHTNPGCCDQPASDFTAPPTLAERRPELAAWTPPWVRRCRKIRRTAMCGASISPMRWVATSRCPSRATRRPIRMPHDSPRCPT